MSFSKALGRSILWGLVLYLIARGAIIIRSAQTVAILSALLASLAKSCGSTSDTGSPAGRGTAIDRCSYPVPSASPPGGERALTSACESPPPAAPR